jgi:hypothetical protein
MQSAALHFQTGQQIAHCLQRHFGVGCAANIRQCAGASSQRHTTEATRSIGVAIVGELLRQSRQ